MCIPSSIEQNPIVGKSYLLDFIDELSFNVALIVFQFNIWKLGFQFLKIVFKGLLSIHGFLTCSE